MKQKNIRRGFTQEVLIGQVKPDVKQGKDSFCNVGFAPNLYKGFGFTLIELLVVVIIIAVLAAIALPQYNKAVEKARISEMQTILTNLEKAAELHRLNKGTSEAFNPVTDGDITFADFTYDEDAHEYCNARKICISVDQYSADVMMRKRSGYTGAPDYYFHTSWDSTQNEWKRAYASCNVNIDSYGLDNFGYGKMYC